jgi:hypothetical protein
MAVLDVPSFDGLGYVFGGNPVVLTIKDGEPLLANVRERSPELLDEGQAISPRAAP